MIYLVGFMGLLLLVAGAIIVHLYCTRPQKAVITGTKQSGADITLEDFIYLATTCNAVDINLLIADFHIETLAPEFCVKYQARYKEARELYFKEVVAIFGRDKREYISKLLDGPPEFSISDVLLVLMCERRLDNRTMAKVMDSSLDTLKKRKTRLRAKLQAKGMDLKADT